MQRAARFSTPALSIPNLWYYMPAIAGMVLTTLVALDRVVGVLRGQQAPAEEAHPC
jgi:TRAP-type C4-dicarboxylate transport system permease small subunit